MDVQFRPGIAGGAQKSIPTQQMRLFIQQQRPAGRPVAVPNVLHEPRMAAQQCHAQTQNVLSFPGCTNVAGSFQAVYPQHPGFLGDHPSLPLRQPHATNFGAAYVPQAGTPDGQQANPYYYPRQHGHLLATANSGGSSDSSAIGPPVSTSAALAFGSPPSVVGVDGTRDVEGQKRANLENSWHYALHNKRHIQQATPTSGSNNVPMKGDSRTWMLPKFAQANGAQGAASPSVAYMQHGRVFVSHPQTAQQQQFQLQRQHQTQHRQTAVPRCEDPIMGGFLPIGTARPWRPAGVPSQRMEYTSRIREDSSVNGSSAARCEPSFAADPPRAHERIVSVTDQAECGDRLPQTEAAAYRRLRSSSALPRRPYAAASDAPPSGWGSSRRSMSSAGARPCVTVDGKSGWTGIQGDAGTPTEQSLSGHGPIGEPGAEALPSVTPPRTNVGTATGLRASGNSVAGESVLLAPEVAGTPAGNRKPLMNAQRIAGSRRPPPRTCASAGTINPRNVSNIGEKYKDRARNSSVERKCSRTETRKSLWEANGKTRPSPPAALLPRSGSAAPVTCSQTRRAKAPNSTLHGAPGGSRLRGIRGAHDQSSAKESEASSAENEMSEEDKPATAALSPAQNRLSMRSRAPLVPGRGVPRGMPRGQGDPRHSSDSRLQTYPTERVPTRRGPQALNKPEAGKHLRSCDRRSELSASHGRLPLGDKSDVEESDLGDSYARRRGYSLARRGTCSSPDSRLVSADWSCRSASRAATGARARPDAAAERSTRRPGFASALVNNSGTDSLRTRPGVGKGGILGTATSRRQPTGPAGSSGRFRARDVSTVLGGRRFGSGDSSSAAASRSTSSLESIVLPDLALSRDDETRSETYEKRSSALLQGSGTEEGRFYNSVCSSRCESGCDEPSFDEEEADLSGRGEVARGPFPGTEMVREELRKSTPTSDAPTQLLNAENKKTRGLTGDEAQERGLVTRIGPCGTVLPPFSSQEPNKVSVAANDGEASDQGAPPLDNLAMSERSTSASRGPCSASPRSISDASGPQSWEASSSHRSSGTTTPVVEGETLDGRPVAGVPRRAVGTVCEGLARQGLLGDAHLVTDCGPSFDREAPGFTGERREGNLDALTQAAHALMSSAGQVPAVQNCDRKFSGGPSSCAEAVAHQQPGVEERVYQGQAQADAPHAPGHQVNAVREPTAMSGSPRGAERSDQTGAHRRTPPEQGQVAPSAGRGPSVASAQEQQTGDLLALSAAEAAAGASPSPPRVAARVSTGGLPAGQLAHSEQLRQQMREKVEQQMLELQHAQLRQQWMERQQQMVEHARAEQKHVQQQAEQNAQTLQHQVFAQQAGPALVRVVSVQPGRTLAMSGPMNPQVGLERAGVQPAAEPVHTPHMGESAQSRSGHSSLRQLSGVHQASQRVVLRQAVSEQQLRRPTLSPARAAVPEQEQRRGYPPRMPPTEGEARSSDTAQAPSDQAAVAELQRRVQSVRQTNSVRAFYSNIDVQTPACAAGQVKEIHLDCHGGTDPLHPLRAPSTKGEPLAALARRYLHSQCLTASRCHPMGRQEHDEFVRELWVEKYRVQQDELRRNLALYQQGRPNGLLAAGINPSSAANALRVSESAFPSPAVSLVCPSPSAGAPLMARIGSNEAPRHVVTPHVGRTGGPPPLPVGLCAVPVGDRVGCAAVSPANMSRFVRTRPTVAHPAVAVGNHVAV
ncbi:conserved hypothetical protein [Neospora caninum Liverpool]|uniref:Uncharacterized protein n=1 Tax=Neospora caninum (strain Liverpool) TaxID=572307 RepID=F0VDJ0_NEOCL|nr:conserved hypothetical protein [Neospora caninum Liverpool]CBZ51783.1 conserved hypothetical protein [Neospora caninum Liverpool]CEL65740.1 TPA: hypothetical protein BN1204_015750 [Neospora caninum Liverpool]|eukprot:XP_003881816.1 conserved hypothetical protein [Neospora caninum Liverpool]